MFVGQLNFFLSICYSYYKKNIFILENVQKTAFNVIDYRFLKTKISNKLKYKTH